MWVFRINTDVTAEKSACVFFELHHLSKSFFLYLNLGKTAFFANHKKYRSIVAVYKVVYIKRLVHDKTVAVKGVARTYL